MIIYDPRGSPIYIPQACKFYLSEISIAQAEVLEFTTSLARALKTVSGPGSKT